MGNFSGRPTWFQNELKQLPGLISTTFEQVFDKLVPGETSNIPFRYTKKQFASYHLMVDGLTSPVDFVEWGGSGIFYVVDQIGYIYRYNGSSVQT